MSKSKGVAYKTYKSEHDEAKVILFDEENIKVERRQKHRFKMSWKSIVPLCSGIVTFLILSVVVYFLSAHDSSKTYLFKNIVISDRTYKTESCPPLQSVKRIEIALSRDSNHSCSDTFTCNLLLSETETVKQRNNDLRYNFLVSSDFKLIIVFGYGCSTNGNAHSEISLTTTYINNSHVSVSSGQILRASALKVMEIIYKGLKCNWHQSNFTMASLCVDGFNLSSCVNIFDKEIIRIKKPMHIEYDIFQSLNNSESYSNLQDNLKWAVCEDPSEIVPHVKKVVKSKSSTKEHCLNYEPVDHISVEVVKVQYPMHCLENFTCSNFLSFISKDIHNDLKYNFIFGSHGALYVGGGFRCRTINDGQQNSLNIKVLRASHNSAMGEFQEMRRIAEIIEHGIFCGKIWKNYSIAENCSFDNCYPKYEYMSDNIVSILSTGFKHYEDEMDNNGQVFPYYAKWKSSCYNHHKLHKYPSLQTEQPVDMTTNKILSPEVSFKTTTVTELEETTTISVYDDEADEIENDYDYDDYAELYID